MADSIGKPVYIGFNFAVDRQSATNLISLVEAAMRLQAEEIVVCITSNGGAPDQALYAYEILRACPRPVRTHAISSVQSSAIPLFLSGTRRTASPGATFLFHETTLTSPAPSLRAEELIGHATAMEMNDRWSSTLVSLRTGKPIDTVAQWFKGQVPRDTEFALQNGLVHSIEDLVIPPGAEFAQVPYKFV